MAGRPRTGWSRLKRNQYLSEKRPSAGSGAIFRIDTKEREPGESGQVQGEGTVSTAPGGAPRAFPGGIPCTSAAFAELSAQVLRSGKMLRFQAHGSSMQPLIRDGDVLLVRPVAPGSVRAGDVVLGSQEPGRIVVHRVIRRLAGSDGFRFITQGDALLRPDRALPGADVYGRVVVVERDGAETRLDRPAARMLGWLAAYRSRWGLAPRARRGRLLGGFYTRLHRLAARLLRKLPAFAKHLA